jgi:mono/diheme cytochrome c family protein
VRPRGLEVALAAALALAGALAVGGCDQDRSFARMIEQPRADAYDASSFFADGAWVQPPPAGTVARDAPLGDPLRTEGFDARGYALEVPVTVTAALLRRGRGRYEITCATCHGPDGEGRTAVAERMRLRPPPSLLERVAVEPPGRIFTTISRGYGLMPSYAFHLGVDDRWAVVAYLRALHLSRRAPLERLPADVRARAKERLP